MAPYGNESLAELAVRYGLASAADVANSSVDSLVAEGRLHAEDKRFLESKLEVLQTDAPPDKRPLLDLASSLGYLSARELLRIGFKVGYQGNDRDYRVASYINIEQMMPASRVIDLLERLALPLYRCPHEGLLLYPAERKDALRGPTCSSCGAALVPLTTVSVLGIEGAPIDFAIGGLRFDQIGSALPAEAVPLAAEPMDAEPFDADPMAAEPIDAEPLMAEPLMAEPLAPAPLPADPIDAEPLMAEPLMAAPLPAEPVGAAEAIPAAEPMLGEAVAGMDSDSSLEITAVDADSEVISAEPFEPQVSSSWMVAETSSIEMPVSSGSLSAITSAELEAIELDESDVIDVFDDALAEPASARDGATRSFTVSTGPTLVEEESFDESLPVIELAGEIEVSDLLIDDDEEPGDTGLFRPGMRLLTHEEELARRIVLRYRFLDASRYALLMRMWSRQDPPLLDYLMMSGHITEEQRGFTLRRVKEVLDAQELGPIGNHHAKPMLERAGALGYVNPATVGVVLRARQLSESSDELTVLQALFNHGHIEFWQAIDLLEGRGILLWHCPSCMTQIPEVDEEIDACPNDGSELVCLTGWGDPKEAEEPLPEIGRLIGAVNLTLALEPPDEDPAPDHSASGDVHAAFVFESNRKTAADTMEMPTPSLSFNRGDDGLAPVDTPMAAPMPAAPMPAAPAPRAKTPAGKARPQPRRAPAPAQPAGPDREQVKRLLLHYQLMSAEEITEATRQVGDGSLLAALEQFGYLKRPAMRFLKRALGLEPKGAPKTIGEAAKAYGYGSSLPAPMGIIDGNLPLEVEVPLATEAYNMGFLQLYQLYDLLDTTGVQLEHCSYHQRQFHVTDPLTFVPRCPECDGQLEPVTGERAVAARDLDQPLARFNRLRVETYQRPEASVYESGVMLAHAPAPSKPKAVPAAAPVDHAAVLPERDTLVYTLLEQYRVLSAKELNKAWNKREFSDHSELPLDQFLQVDGWLNEREAAFIDRKHEQLRSGDAGSQVGYSIGELGISKGYVSREAFVDLMQHEAAPTREDGEGAIAGHLFNHRALRFYQVLDLLEGCGLLLCSCPDCGEQVQIDNHEDGRDYPCPICWQPLLPLTIPPGRTPRLVQIPPIEEFRVFRIDAEQLGDV